jgi:glucan 1,3-beta-glucosidase
LRISANIAINQYNFAETVNTFAGMIQTESPYFQYADATESPGPFNDTIGLFSNDPTFPDETDTCAGTDLLCNFAWSVLLGGVTNLTIAGAGLYSWFDAYDQSICVDAQNCQQRLVNDQGYNAGLYLWNLVTIGSIEMVSDTYFNTSILAANNTQIDSHPFWSALAAYANDASSGEDECDDESTESWCMIDTYCDYTLQFSNLIGITAAEGLGLIDPICSSFYTLQVLSDMLNTEVANYTIVNEGYDGVFGDYVDYIKEMVPDALTQFMAPPTASNPAGGAGNKYFNCEYSAGLRTGSQACPISVSNSRYLSTRIKIDIHLYANLRISRRKSFTYREAGP